MWWKESCANWAAMLYADEVLNDLSTRFDEYEIGIESYLATTTLSLTKAQNSREYSVLFPLLPAQDYRNTNTGADTILYIYNEINAIRMNTTARTNQQIFNAIDGVVRDIKNKKLRKILEEFGKNNYSVENNYEYLQILRVMR